ncbi:MAG: hypothetical protein AAB426_08715 [Myxococcota bacterium]
MWTPGERDASPRTVVYLGLGLVTGATLLFETTLLRLLSMTLWYPIGYLVLATAMLGLGSAAVALALSRRLAAIAPRVLLHHSALGLGFSIALGYPTWNLLPLAPLSAARDPAQLVWMALLVIIVALPFAFAGLFVSRCLATWPQHAPTLYAVDLVSGALGVLLLVMLLPRLGAPGLILVAAAMALGAAATTAPSLHRRTLVALTAALYLWLAPSVEQLVPPRVTPNKLLGTPTARDKVRGTRWSLSSAIDVIANDAGALLVVDGGSAMSFVPRLERGLGQPGDYGLRGLPFVLRPIHSTLVLGSGGGVEVAAARAAGAERVLALEVDPVVNELVRTRLARQLDHLFSQPEVELVTAEARSYLAAHPERFDLIMGFHTISNAASATGALSLAENYLLTVEAMALLLDRLTPQGLLVLSRPEQQAGRLLATLAAAWPGPQPLAQSVAVLAEGQASPAFVTAVLVSRAGFDADAVARLRELAPGRLAYLPDGRGDTQDYFAAVLASSSDPARAAALGATLPYSPTSLEPTRDGRPFFNLARPWCDLRPRDFVTTFGSGQATRARIEDAPLAQVSMLLVLCETLLLGLGLLVPAWHALARRGLGSSAVWPIGGFCAAIGVAFMVVEVVLLQSFTRLVGEPGWSLVTVLAPLLVASGAGSLYLAGKRRLSPRLGALWAALAALPTAVALPPLIDLSASFGFATRLGVGALATFALGVPLGIPFAAALRRLTRPELVAWAWATNAVASVAGSLGAVMIGSAFGFATAATLAAGLYVVAAVVAHRLAPRVAVV